MPLLHTIQTANNLIAILCRLFASHNVNVDHCMRTVFVEIAKFREHKFGSTTITEAPERVVAIGYTEQDLLLAVDVQPVAVRYWYGDENNAIFPWAQDKVEGETPIVLNMPYGNLNYQAILALEPDLISAVTAGITQEEYELLSQIAPTIAQSGDYIDFGMPWQEATQMVGAALGKRTRMIGRIRACDTLHFSLIRLEQRRRVRGIPSGESKRDDGKQIGKRK